MLDDAVRAHAARTGTGRAALRVFAIVAVAAVAIVAVVAVVGFSIPRHAPSLGATLTPRTQAPPSQIGGYALLGRTLGATDAAHLGPASPELTPGQGAVAITADLIARGRDVFYLETFGDEVFFTDVLGVLDGPLTLGAMSRAILALGGRPTANLRVPIAHDVTIGGRHFAAGTVVDTGLDVPPRALVPLGIRLVVAGGRIRVGVTCALCHATVDPQSGRIIEGAPNADLEAGLLLAFASNSAAMFRQTGAKPYEMPAGQQHYRDANGADAVLPDAAALEDAVDVDLLAWPPGSFDSTGDLVDDPSQIPSSYTFGAAPYGWSGFAAIGWFDGLTTLNNNVHATNSDPTTGTDGSMAVVGMDRDAYLGVIFQHAARAALRLPPGASPSAHFAAVDPTPGVPGMNRVVPMPGYPQGSPFMLDGLMAVQPGRPTGEALNAMSAWQNTLAPPPRPDVDRERLAAGAAVFSRAGCDACHTGPRFTDNRILPVAQVGTQPARAAALAAFPRLFGPPLAYAPDVPSPPPADAPVLPVPVDGAPPDWMILAYAQDGHGGYKVPGLVGLAVTAPYLHDGGVAVAADALAADGGVASEDGLGLPGTVFRHVPADPANSLRALVDRRLRDRVVAANHADARLVRANVDGSGHAFWVDAGNGFRPEDTAALVEYLLSIDDAPQLP